MVQCGMLKITAINLLGGTIPAAAEAIGVTYQAVDKWPDELPQRIVDRVFAAVVRKHPSSWKKVWPSDCVRKAA